MSRRKKDAERHFAESLRARPLRPVVETDYTRLEAARRAEHGRRETITIACFWVLMALVAAICEAVG